MLNKEEAPRQLYDLLISRDLEPETFTGNGEQSAIPSEAALFKFDFVASSGKDYGSVVVMLEENAMSIYYSDNIGKSFEDGDKKEWFDFLHQLKQFATRHFMSFDIKNVNRMKFDLQTHKGLNEAWSGNRQTSYDQKPNNVRLMIRHNRQLGEHDQRFRHIDSLFLETTDGERFKLPFNSLSGGRAMVEHVRQGGRPYDTKGQRISQMVEELNVLRRFNRVNRDRVCEDDTQSELLEHAKAYYEELTHTLKRMRGPRGYKEYFESWEPMEITEGDVIIEHLRNCLVESVTHIQLQENNMKEVTLFESWANRLVEGCWTLPDTPEKQKKLLDLMSKPLIAGPDGTNATQQLYHVFGDDSLFDAIEDAAKDYPEADVRSTVVIGLQKYEDNPQVAAVLSQINLDQPDNVDEPEQVDVNVDADFEEPTVSEEYSYDETLGNILKHAGVGDVSNPAKSQNDRKAPSYEVSDYDELDEGYRIIPPLDPGYEERAGLEGPINANGRPLYYDTKEGKYYDPRTDMYIDHDEARELMKEDDDEGSYVKDELHSIMRNAGQLEKVVSDGDSVPEWVSGKLAQAKGMVQGVNDYIQDRIERGAEQATGIEGIRDIEVVETESPRAFIVTAKTYEGKTKQFRVHADSEDSAREKFGQHHSMANVLDIHPEEAKKSLTTEVTGDRLSSGPSNPVSDPELSRLVDLASFKMVR